MVLFCIDATKKDLSRVCFEIVQPQTYEILEIEKAINVFTTESNSL